MNRHGSAIPPVRDHSWSPANSDYLAPEDEEESTCSLRACRALARELCSLALHRAIKHVLTQAGTDVLHMRQAGIGKHCLRITCPGTHGHASLFWQLAPPLSLLRYPMIAHLTETMQQQHGQRVNNDSGTVPDGHRPAKDQGEMRVQESLLPVCIRGKETGASSCSEERLQSENNMTNEKTPASPWIKLPPRGRGRVCLFCFPYAGGGNAAYLPWMREISPEIEICPVQPPGREERIREQPFVRLQPLVEAAAQALEPYLQIPFAFFGHSLGALISFELTRYLRRQGWPLPLHLFVAGFSAPQLPQTHAPLHEMPAEKFRTALALFNGTPASVLENDDLMQLLIPLLRADFAVYETYLPLPEPPLDLPISAYGGLHDTHATRQRLEEWRVQTTKRFNLRMYDGDHFFLQTKRSLLLQGIHQDLFATLSPRSS